MHSDLAQLILERQQKMMAKAQKFLGKLVVERNDEQFNSHPRRLTKEQMKSVREYR